jgi:DNA-directed RNA polymerase specialized sigma24 family protein
MPPPPSTSVASRLFLGPALRAQADRRLVSLVRDGYESAFEEIVRRYGKPLGRYAAAIVSANRAEDVTQDAFSKALLALRDTDKEIELVK